MTRLGGLLKCNVVTFKHFIGFAILTSRTTLKAIRDLLKYNGRYTHISSLPRALFLCKIDLCLRPSLLSSFD